MLDDLFVGTIPLRIQIFAITGSFSLLGVVVYLIRHGKLKEGYSILWFFIGIALVVFSTITRMLDFFSRSVGISYSPAALFLILIGGLFLLSLHFSVLVSKHDRRIRELAQENALLKVLLNQEKRQRPVPTLRAEVVSFVHEKESSRRELRVP